MAKFEFNGFCPEKDVWRILKERKDYDVRLIGLWSIIAPIAVCINSDVDTVDNNAVIDMFSSDCIAYSLMSQLAKYAADPDRIAIKQIYFDRAKKTQNLDDCQKLLSEAKNPKIVAKTGSRFLVVISEGSYGVDLHFWDLNRCP